MSDEQTAYVPSRQAQQAVQALEAFCQLFDGVHYLREALQTYAAMASEHERLVAERGQVEAALAQQREAYAAMAEEAAARVRAFEEQFARDRYEALMQGRQHEAARWEAEAQLRAVQAQLASAQDELRKRREEALRAVHQAAALEKAQVDKEIEQYRLQIQVVYQELLRMEAQRNAMAAEVRALDERQRHAVPAV